MCVEKATMQHFFFVFFSLHELVRHGDNGLIFHTYSELAVELQVSQNTEKKYMATIILRPLLNIRKQ